MVNDQFNADGVPSHWHLYDGPYGSAPSNCASPSQVSVSGGVMHMLMSYRADLPACSGTQGPATHWYTAGMMIDAAYASKDQRVTVRFRIVDFGTSGHHIIPMRFPNTGINGEEDYCESGLLSDCSTFLHYNGYASQLHHAYTVDLSQWHVMRFQRRNYVVSAYIDDMSTPKWTYLLNPATLPSNDGRVVLQQECHSAGCPTGTTGIEDIQIDWIWIANPRG